jgi:hypothetical protein
MMSTPQIMQMINELRREELDRMSVHRIDALSHRRESVRGTVASALVRLGMTLDGRAAARAATTRMTSSSAQHEVPHVRAGDIDTALHW